MPLLNFHLLNLMGNVQPHTFLSNLHEADPSTKVIVASKPRHFVVKATTQDASILNRPWDLMLLLQGPNASLPSSLEKHISSSYSLPVGIPSKLLSTYPEKNARLIKEAPSAGLTGSLENPKMPDSSQKLELSPELLKFMEELMKEHDGPVTMLNLLKFKAGGKESYYQYGQVSCFLLSLSLLQDTVWLIKIPKHSISSKWQENEEAMPKSWEMWFPKTAIGTRFP